MAETDFIPKNPENIQKLVGINDGNLNLLSEGYDVSVTDTGNQIVITGDSAGSQKVVAVLKALDNVVSSGVNIGAPDVVSAMKMADKGTTEYFLDLYKKILIRDAKGKPIRVKNMGQKRYVEAIQKSDVVFGIGPAGTGKTFLAVVCAISAFKKGEVSRIILTRPAVEAGESLGFLPGDLKEKVDPYLRPIYDSLYAILGKSTTERLMERGVIEVAPLAYMRGRTLDDAFVILDEAQNTTDAQMKMFLTRLGFNSKMIVNGDITQVDLPGRQHSGLIDARRILRNIDQIKFVKFTSNDVVRHPVVAKIINAYEKEDAQRKHGAN
ncbi:PhoH family protein [Lactobacillus acetotolerans]|uniref:PhoH-like protein n=1 Tax=Lactobacillus acetotolerans TaxID=1600 RepID=A0A353UA20_9LACO|nr:PhoH family protein [Lactobacillus acetotolerans]KRN38925.1 PhoH family phosphate starvation-induced protein [Lactobacillus acetotolerans DSM 20749 = JCM 3825]QFG51264.1 phosphate starvation-inducible protein PhoH [Lactobacillus acetotolerans]QJD73560.1 phosphate starvation-inducible protein PhoH [Lactobacillus acetotolerans]GGV17528.1 phosphate starvation protein PhoH [Lactobacillus acetotolerans DSM 20749 = JCM 3825]HBG90856.1 phosphate starvation-inducible protein PhoH [Lactobacillus ace